ncbi:MAG: aminopeptidase N, partial [Desulfuromusa sp.]|nr:aminopeptidase N [Desulfuromusa sp.]
MTNRLKSPETIHLRDYKTHAYLVEQVELTFVLEPSATQVQSRVQLYRNPDRAVAEPLVLAGNSMQLIGIKLDGTVLSENAYQLDGDNLTILNVPEKFTLEIETQIDPAGNTSLEGLYQSSGNFCTQCEAHGFRKITYYPDRPDVMACFRVRIEADKQYPVLLSNGNLVGQGDLPDCRHYAEWEDP